MTMNDKEIKRLIRQDEELFPQFYVSRPPKDIDDLAPVYYRVLNGVLTEWMRESMDEPKKDTIYDLWMEDRSGFGVERIDEEDTPFPDYDARSRVGFSKDGTRICTECGESVENESYMLWLFHTCRDCAEATATERDKVGHSEGSNG